MEKFISEKRKLGVIAGGQLGKLLIQEASKWGLTTYTLDKDASCPASGISTVFVQGDHLDYDAVYQFGKMVDLLTFEIESVNIEALKQLKSEGLQIYPDPLVMELFQDKGLQKLFYAGSGIPSPAFRLVSGKEEILDLLAKEQLCFPFVQKLRKGGYDGQGVAVLKSTADMHKLLAGASIIEDLVDIDREIGIIVARNANGETCSFPPVEMAFNPMANLVEMLICPAELSPDQKAKATAMAESVVSKLELVGLLSVELFVDKQGNLFVNECAPRPHNSGHHTIESVQTSQYEQHLRAIFNLALGNTKLRTPAVMLNLLGSIGHEGMVKYEGLIQILAIDGVKVHLYGKKHTRPYRKMGHVTIISDTINEAIAKAEQVKGIIKAKT